MVASCVCGSYVRVVSLKEAGSKVFACASRMIVTTLLEILDLPLLGMLVLVFVDGFDDLMFSFWSKFLKLQLVLLIHMTIVRVGMACSASSGKFG